MPPLGRLLALAVLLPIIAPCSSSRGADAVPDPPPGTSVDPCAPWGCEQQARFDAAIAFLAKQKGTVGIVVKDRETGAVWRAGDPDVRTWAGSTPKLALAVALKEQARAGQTILDSQDNAAIDAMLSVSDNVAADRLWNKHANGASMMKRWQTTYGMTTASYVDGFPQRWGFVKLAPQDLVALMSYVLDQLDKSDNAFFVERMRAVGGPQQWGVWGAGPALRPGVKDGWDYAAEAGQKAFRWVTSTVGFVGPGERYVVAAMYDQVPGGDSIGAGVHVLTDLVATVFGAPVPAPAVVPEDY
jgi:hypothetical protein